MQIILLLLIFLCLAWIACLGTYFLLVLIRFADKKNFELPFFEDRKQKIEEAKRQEIRNEQYDKMLEELSEKKQQEKKAKEASAEGFEYNELDDLADIERSETDPDALLELLEFGIPDEELNTVLNSLESAGQGALS